MSVHPLAEQFDQIDPAIMEGYYRVMAGFERDRRNLEREYQQLDSTPPAKKSNNSTGNHCVIIAVLVAAVVILAIAFIAMSIGYYRLI